MCSVPIFLQCTRECQLKTLKINAQLYYNICGPGSIVGIVSGYGMDSMRIESQWDEILCTCPDWPWGPPSLLYNGYRVFPGGKERLEHDADPSPTSSAIVKKE